MTATREILVSLVKKDEYDVQAIIKQGNQMPTRKSDNGVIPMKLGNSSGGKAVT